MKKLALSSLIAVFAVSGAHAANVINDNPLYMPKANHFYSVTDVSSHSESEKTWAANENFGYGITNNLAVNVSTTVMDERSFDQWSWKDMRFGATFRALNEKGFVADVYGQYALDSIEMPGFEAGGVWPNHRPFMDEDDTTYTWTAGLRAGFMTSNWTLAGHVAFNYTNAESFNWGDKGMHTLKAGIDGLVALCDNLSLIAGVEYTGVLDDNWAYDNLEGPKVDNAGVWNGTFGVNYNIDATKYVGLYVKGSMDHWKDNGQKGWGEMEDGFGYGVKFGIDF